MAYKRYIKKKGKVYGPYIYKSIRGKNGDVKSKYVGKAEPEPAKKARFTLQGKQAIQRNLFLILFIILVVIGGILFIVQPTGLVIREEVKFQIVGINWDVNETQQRVVNLSAEPKSISVSGFVRGNGSVRVYAIENGKRYLIYERGPPVAGPPFTGMAIGEGQTEGDVSEITQVGPEETPEKEPAAEEKEPEQMEPSAEEAEAGIPSEQEEPPAEEQQQVSETEAQAEPEQEEGEETITHLVTTPTEKVTEEAEPEIEVTPEEEEAINVTPEEEFAPIPPLSENITEPVAEPEAEPEINITEPSVKITENVTEELLPVENITNITNITLSNVTYPLENITNVTFPEENVTAENITEENVTENVTVNVTEKPEIVKPPEEIVYFKDACIETCTIFGFTETLTLLVEVDPGTSVLIEKIIYTIAVPAINNLAVLVQEIPDIGLVENGRYTLDLSDYFEDPDGDELTYYSIQHYNITITFTGSMAIIIPDENFAGIRNTIFYANDGINTTASNLVRINVTENVTNVTIELVIQQKAVIGQPVRWAKRIKLPGRATNITIRLPRNATNITIKKIEKEAKQPVAPENITIIKPEGGVTGERVLVVPKTIKPKIVVNETLEETEVVIEEPVEEIEIEYCTDPPMKAEENISKYRKRVTIYSVISYENITSFAYLPSEAPANWVHLYWLQDGKRTEIQADKYDTNDNGLVDYIEWTVEHTSSQTYEILIIPITKALHLDQNRNLISDIYDEVKDKDNVWSEPINPNEYVRVTFEQPLDNTRDITIYARSTTNATADIEVYTGNSDELVTTFKGVSGEDWYKVYLTNLPAGESHDVFDLRVLGSPVEFDYIVDPIDKLYETSTADGPEDGTAIINLSSSQDGGGNSVTIQLAGGNLYNFVNATSSALGSGIIIMSGSDVNFSAYFSSASNVNSAYATWKFYKLSGSTETLICKNGSDDTTGVPVPAAGTSGIIKGNCSPSSTIVLTATDKLKLVINVWAETIGGGGPTTKDLIHYWDTATYDSWVQYGYIVLPKTNETSVNATTVDRNETICINHTVTKGTYDVDKTWVEITFPNGTQANITTSNTSGVCGAGGSVYGVQVDVGSSTGTLTVNTSWANDTQGNYHHEDPYPNITVSVINPPPAVTSVTATPQKALNGSTINITADVSDSDGVSIVQALLYYPNGTNFQNLTMSNGGSGDVYWNDSYTVNFYPSGTYNVTIWANDSLGNVNQSEKTWFTPYLVLSDSQDITINGSFEDWVGIKNVSDVVGDAGSKQVGDPYYVWNWTFYSVAMSAIYGVAVDSNDDFIGVGGDGDGDFFIVRFNSSNEQTWNTTIEVPGNNNDFLDVVVDSQDNFIAVGPNQTDTIRDWTILKFNSSNDQLWNLTTDMGGAFDTPDEIIVDSQDNFIIGGWNSSSAAADWLIIKYNSNNQEVWRWNRDLGGNDRIRDIVVDSDDNIIVFGGSNGDCTVMKFNSSYDDVWNASFDLGGTDMCFALGIDTQDNFMVGGGPQNGEWFLAKYNSSNDQVWNTTITVGTDGWPFDIAVDSEENFIIGGRNEDSWWMFKYNSSNDVIWNYTRNLAGGTTEEILSVAVDSKDNIYTSGWESNSNGYIARYNQNKTPRTDFDIKTVSLSNNDSNLFALIEVNGSINYSRKTKYYRLFISRNDSAGNATTPEGENLAFKYDYRIQSYSQSMWMVYNSTGVNTVNITTLANNPNTTEIAINLSYINVSVGDNINVTFETAGSHYDFAPDYSSFLSYDIAGEAPPADNSPTVILNEPVNYANLSDASVTFNCTASDDINLTNVTLWGNWTGSGWQANETNDTGISGADYIFDKAISDGYYVWNCRACDNSTAGQCAFANPNWTFTVDTQNPSVSLVSPVENYNSSSADIDFQFNVTDTIAQTLNCSLYINNTLVTYNATTLNATTSNFTRPVSEGNNQNWTVNCSDPSGNSNQPGVRNFTVDTQNPSVTLISPVENYNSSSSNIDFQFNVTDNLASTLNCSLYINNTLVTYNASTLNATPTNFTQPVSEGQNQNWTVNCSDPAGNSNQPAVRNFSADLTYPVASFGTNPVDNYNTSSQSITFDLKCSDGVGVDTLQLWGNWTGTWHANQTNSTPINDTYWNKTVDGIPQGVWGWGVWCNDSTGRSGWTGSNRTFTVDTQSPSVSLISPVENYNSSSSNIDFQFNVTDNLASTLNCSLYINGTLASTNSSTLNGTTTTFSESGLSEAINQNWTVNCSDPAGNSNQSAVRNFTVDTQNPSVSLISPVENYNSSSSNIDLQFNVTDNLASTLNCSLYINGTLASTNSSTLNGTTTTFSESGLSEATSQNWTVNCSDPSGNSNQPDVRNFTVDLTNPVASFGTNPVDNYNTSSQSITFDLKCSDGVGVDTLQLWGNWTGTWHANQTNSTPINDTYWNKTVDGIPQGVLKWGVWCNDSAGRSGRTGSNRTFTVDTQSPSVSLISPVENYNSSSADIDFQFNVTDNLASTLNCSLYINNTLVTYNATTLDATTTNFTRPVSEGKNQNWTVNCSDPAGNSNQSAVQNFTVDLTDPNIGNKSINETGTVNLNTIVCLNVSGVSDTGSGVDKVWAEVTQSNGSVLNLTMSDPGPCGVGGGWYSVNVNVGDIAGTFYYNASWVNDTAGNLNSNVTVQNLSVSDVAAPTIVIRREQPNSTGPEQNVTVWLIVWNTDSSQKNVTDLNLTEWIDSDWTVVDCGSCDDNTSINITWELGNISTDNYTMVFYKIQAPSSAENSTFKANATYKYDSQTGTVQGAEFNVSVKSGYAYFDFELDMDISTSAVDRDVPNGTDKTVNYTVTNVGDSTPADTVTVELKINKTAWNVSCEYCEEFTSDSDYYYLRWNESTWNVKEMKQYNFTVNSSVFGYYNFSSNGSYDPPMASSVYYATDRGKTDSIESGKVRGNDKDHPDYFVNRLADSSMSQQDNTGKAGKRTVTPGADAIPAKMYLAAMYSEYPAPAKGTTNTTSAQTVSSQPVKNNKTENISRPDLLTGLSRVILNILSLIQGQFLNIKALPTVEISPVTVNITGQINETEPQVEKPKIITAKEHFRADESPEFELEVQAPVPGTPVTGFLLTTPAAVPEKVDAYVEDSSGRRLKTEPEIGKSGEKYRIKIKRERAFRAGLYRLKVELARDGETCTFEQDFGWGVLAINTHKSIYLENETAFIGIAVLDDAGHTVCDADVVLKITDPNGDEKILSTDNGLLKVSPECEVYGVTTLPDYYGDYNVSGPGTYVMNLTAVTTSGIRTITDRFLVQTSVDFDVARDGPTRIYPPVPYVMNFTARANRDYDGPIVEYVPVTFEVMSQDGLTVSTLGDTKILTWDKKLVKGETYNLAYEFDAPDITPYLFILGPLSIGSWQEARNWQIASDGTFVDDSNQENTTSLNEGGSLQIDTQYDNYKNDVYWVNLSHDSTKILDDGCGGGAKFYIGSVNTTDCGSDADSCTWDSDNDHVTVDTAATVSQVDRHIYWNLVSCTGSAGSYTFVCGDDGGTDPVNCDSPSNTVIVSGEDNSPNVTSLNYPPNNANVSSIPVDFNFTAQDDHNVSNCTLWGNFSGNWAANETVYNVANNTEVNITISIGEGYYEWNVECWDNATTPQSDWFGSNYSVTIDTTDPGIGNKSVNETGSVSPNTIVCLNVSGISDSGSGVDRVWAEVTQSNASVLNLTMSDSGPCGGGEGWYSVNVNVGNIVGTFYYNASWVNDTAGNVNSNTTVQNLSVAIKVWVVNTENHFVRVTVVPPVDNPPEVVSLNYPSNNANLSSVSVDFNFTAIDDHNVSNCTLWGNFSGNWDKNETIYNVANNTEVNITVSPGEGYYEWNVECWDNATTPQSDWYESNYSVTIDTTDPAIGNKSINQTGSVEANTVVCLNVSGISDTGSGIHTVWAEITQSDGSVLNLTMSDTGPCGGGDGWYSVNANVGNSAGTFYYNASWVNDTAGNVNSNTTVQNLSVIVSNTAPNTTRIILNATSANNYTTDDLKCYAEGYDEEQTTLNAYFWWWNGTQLFQKSNTTISNGTLSLVSTLPSANTNKSEVWNCSVMMSDFTVNETDWNNASITILNTPPGQVTLTAPPDGSNTTNRTPMFSWETGNDDNNDQLNYTINITCGYVGGGSDCSIDNREVNLTGADICSNGFCNYTPTQDLQYFGDDNYYYNWTVRAYDGEQYGAWSGVWNLTIYVDVVITLYNNTVDFGSILLGQTNATTDNDPGPFRLRNDGNCFVDVNISADPLLWTTQASPSEYFLYMADNVTGEENSLNWSSDNTTKEWTPVPLSNGSIISFLNYSDATDEAEIELNITAPQGEGAGSKSSTMWFTAGYRSEGGT